MIGFDYIKSIGIGIITGFVNGFFGSGGGIIVVPALESIVGLKKHEAHATAIGVILPLSILSAFVYMKQGLLTKGYLSWITLGGVLGGYIGAKWLPKISTSWLHKIFGIFMIVAAIRMMIV
ncbi:MAG: sulfite exporter TauE/SafE family protein [Epulopiscium sp.]|nr:sulfite exporter TauE/SafE family protein [Candidatus Epulonipiscium sp.]